MWHTVVEILLERMNRPSTAWQPKRFADEEAIVWYRCLLDEQPTDLLPLPALAKLRKTKVTEDLVLNPFCHFSPLELSGLPFGNRFYGLENTLWILDPDANALVPYWLGPELQQRLAGLRPGDPAPSSLPREMAAALRFAEVLIPHGHRERQRYKRRLEISKSSRFFHKNRYVSLKGLLPAFQVAELRRYIRALIAKGRLEVGKREYRNCYLKHNESVVRFFHHQLTSTISEVVREPVQPSFAFICCYSGGAELSKHTDREQCELTVSLCADFIPEPRNLTSWPLCIDTSRGRVTIHQALGDAILFCGRDMAHYRDKLTQGFTSTSILFHFVRRNFDGKLD